MLEIGGGPRGQRASFRSQPEYPFNDRCSNGETYRVYRSSVASGRYTYVRGSDLTSSTEAEAMPRYCVDSGV